MSRTATCPHCAEPLDVPAEFAGRAVRCAVCEQVFTPPADPFPAAARSDRNRALPADVVPAARRPTRTADSDWDDAPRRRRPGYDDRPRRKSGNNTWVVLLVLGLFGAGVCVIGGGVVWMVVLMNPDFEAYDAPDGRFGAEFPGKPTTTARKTAGGPDRTEVKWTRSFPPETYFVRYVDLPAVDVRKGPDAALQDACNALEAETPGCTETGRAATTHDGYPAVDVAFEHPNDGGGTVARVVLAGNRVYVVGVACELGIEADEPRAEHFLRAFRVKSDAPPR